MWKAIRKWLYSRSLLSSTGMQSSRSTKEQQKMMNLLRFSRFKQSLSKRYLSLPRIDQLVDARAKHELLVSWMHIQGIVKSIYIDLKRNYCICNRLGTLLL